MKQLFIFFAILAIKQSTASIESVLSFDKEFKFEKYENSKEIHHINKRDVNSCATLDNYASALNNSQHIFKNDGNPSISLTWSGPNGVLLAVTTMSYGLSVSNSKLYRSTNRGGKFVDITSQIGGVNIRKSYGIQVSPVDTSMVFLVGYDAPIAIGGVVQSKLYMSENAGASWTNIQLPFMIDPSTIKFNPIDKYSWLVKSIDQNSAVWASNDFGRKFNKIAEYVPASKWDPIVKDLLYYVTDPTMKMSSTGVVNELYSYSTTSNTATLLAQHVHSFTVQENYLFASVEFIGRNKSRVLHVSKNQGKTWNAAQVPLINSDQFYSLLDMSEGMVFVHVDVPTNNGHGSIYTSDASGVIYSKSLVRHLYPNQAGITDFYKVLSLDGTYITSQLQEDNTVHSMISFDKGGLWQPLEPPSGSVCGKTEKTCKLQIHNYFSMSKRVKLPSLPLSSSHTVGLVMAHGNIGDGLSFSPPSVFISGDGGFSWRQPSDLKGPHFYGIGDSGGILFAIPLSEDPINTLKFSLDEGLCWHNYTFTEQPLQVTGVSAEPGEKATDLSIWGWDRNGDGSWMALTVDFAAILGSDCNVDQYTTWKAHESDRLNSEVESCNLGAHVSYVRRVKGSVCRNSNLLVATPVKTTCECQLADYLCDYGYKRAEDGSCSEDLSAATSGMDICIGGFEEKIVTQGYLKIPGDICEGGYEPPHTLKTVSKSCVQLVATNGIPEVIDENYGVDKNSFEKYPNKQGSSNVGLVVFLVILVLGLGGFLSVLIYRKRKTILRVRYTPLNQGENGGLAGTATVVNEDTVDDIPYITNTPPSGVNGAMISYHDDSDEDLLMT